jgi:hypothetical protein
MKQKTLATLGFDKYTKTTRRAAFLAEMERVVPWSELCALIERYIRSLVTGALRWGWKGCCGSTFCSTGSTCRIRQ